MSSRGRIALRSVGILGGLLALSLVVRVLTAREDALAQTLRVTSRVELSPGRALVRVAPEDDARSLAVERVTRYPFGWAVVTPGGAGSPARPPRRPIPVRTARLAPGPVARRVTAFGTVEAARDARVAVEATGVVTRLRVALGEAVAEGAPLVDLDARDAQHRARRAEAERQRAAAAQARAADGVASLESQLTTAQATLEVRGRDLERWRTLAAQDLASRDRLDQADVLWRAALGEAQRADGALRQARAALDEARAALALAAVEEDAARLGLERCVLRAPFAGAVAERLVQEGQWVAAGAPAVRLVSTDRVRVRVHVREDDAVGVAAGGRAEVLLPGLQAAGPALAADGAVDAAGPFPAQVEGVAAAADPTTRTFAVDVAAPAGGGLRPGVFARVTLDGGVVPHALLVPDAAIAAADGAHHVFVVVDGARVRRVPVTLGPRQGEARLLRGGLGAGPVEVVVEGTNLLADGAPVEPQAPGP